MHKKRSSKFTFRAVQRERFVLTFAVFKFIISLYQSLLKSHRRQKIMKKTLSVLLTVIMAVCCFPFAAFAEETDTVFSKSGSFEASNQLVSNTTYRIDNGVTMTVPSGMTLYIPSGTKLYVEEGAKLVVNGNIVSLDNSQLYVDGVLVGAANVGGSGECYAQFRFPSLKDQGLTKKDENDAPRIKVSYATSTNGNAYEDQQNPLSYIDIPVTGAKAYIPLNQYIYIKAHIIEPDEKNDVKFDDALMNVYANGVGVSYTQGAHIMKVGNAADITYGNWTTDDDFLSTYKIYLPSNKGYTVYGRNGEHSEIGETVYLKYGQSFSFKVEVEPEYDMSQYEVYIYNGYGWTDLDTDTLLKDVAPAKPDQYGYYNIDFVKGDTTVYVIGIVKNETITLVADILSMIRSIFETIKAFFEQFAGIFG